MMHHPLVAVSPAARRPMRGFTLTELLVAMGIIAIIGGITAVGIRTVARDAKMSSASNTVSAALDAGRALAIRENTLVAVVFRARLDEANKQYVEIVTARWSRETPTVVAGGSLRAIDRFIPMPGIASRRIPSGIQVAGPLYHSGYDDEWATQTTASVLLGSTLEEPQRTIGVMFASDGSVVYRNAASDAWRFYVDFNNDNLQQISNCTVCPNGVLDYKNPPNSIPNNGPDFMFNVQMMKQVQVDDEPFVTIVPFLAVYDDEQLRSNYDTTTWIDWRDQQDDLSEFINEFADRLHFNRFTGVVMR